MKKEKSKNLKPEEAAKIMEKDVMFVRKGLQRGILNDIEIIANDGQ